MTGGRLEGMAARKRNLSDGMKSGRKNGDARRR